MIQSLLDPSHTYHTESSDVIVELSMIDNYYNIVKTPYLPHCSVSTITTAAQQEYIQLTGLH